MSKIKMEVISMDKSIGFTEFGQVHEVVSGTRNNRHSFYQRRKKPRVLPWEEESDIQRIQKVLKDGHIDMVC